MRRLESSDEGVRMQATRSLGRNGEIADEVAVGWLVVKMSDPSASVSVAALFRLSRIGEPALGKLMEISLCGKDGDRLNAAKAIAEIGGIRARNILEMLSADPEDGVRQFAEAAVRRANSGSPLSPAPAASLSRIFQARPSISEKIAAARERLSGKSRLREGI